jgi:hypothetical protein
MNKYNAKKTVVDDICFDSKAEALMYRDLKLMEKAGEISNLKLQPKYTLIPAFVNAKGIPIRAVTYRADFAYTDNARGGIKRVVDCKGMRTQTYLLKKKLFDFKFKSKGLSLEEHI